MANLILPGRYQAKPLRGAQLDWSHPLSQGLVGCWLMNEGGGFFNSAVPSTFTKNLPLDPTAFTWTVNKKGGGIKSTVTTAGKRITLGTAPSSIRNSCTIVMAYRKNDATLRATDCVVSKTANALIEIYCPFIDGTVYFDFGNATAGQGRVSVGGLSFGDDIWAFVANSSKREIWQNGINRVTGGANQVLTADGLLELFASSISGPDLATFNFLYIYNRVLSPSAIMSLYIAPYQMIAPVRKKVFFDVSVGGATNQTITPSLLALISSIKSINTSYDYKLTLTTLNLTASLQSITILSGVIITPAVLALTTSLLSPTVKFDYLYTAAALNLIVSLLTPDVTAGTIISISPLALSIALKSPTVNFDYLVQLTALNLAVALKTTAINFDFAVDMTALAISSGLLNPSVVLATGRTYLVFNSSANRLELWVGGTEVARFNQNGSIDVNGAVNQNAF